MSKVCALQLGSRIELLPFHTDRLKGPKFKDVQSNCGVKIAHAAKATQVAQVFFSQWTGQPSLPTLFRESPMCREMHQCTTESRGLVQRGHLSHQIDKKCLHKGMISYFVEVQLPKLFGLIQV